MIYKNKLLKKNATFSKKIIFFKKCFQYIKQRKKGYNKNKIVENL